MYSVSKIYVPVRETHMPYLHFFRQLLVRFLLYYLTLEAKAQKVIDFLLEKSSTLFSLLYVHEIAADDLFLLFQQLKHTCTIHISVFCVCVNSLDDRSEITIINPDPEQLLC